MRTVFFSVLLVLAVAVPAGAQTGLAVNRWPADFRSRTESSTVLVTASPSILTQAIGFQEQSAPPLHAAAVEHSEAYQRRAKIHKIASFATLPLFAGELALGQSLYNNSANPRTRRALHGVVGTGIIGLFGVNTVTGAWNLFGEGWSDKDGRTLRLVHGLLMMAADAGFVATTMTGPNSESRRQALTFESSKVTHRNIALFSIGTGTVSYLIMLFGNH